MNMAEYIKHLTKVREDAKDGTNYIGLPILKEEHVEKISELQNASMDFLDVYGENLFGYLLQLEREGYLRQDQVFAIFTLSM